jgi:hypothetical protein
MDIRKVSIGPDFKSGAMHYIVGQRILGDTNDIHCIKQNASGDISIYIINNKNEIVLWKKFNSSMPISIEYNINF